MLTLQECYEILGLQPGASPQDVRSAYIKLVKRWHPDASKPQRSKGNSQERFLQIQKAYEHLKQHQATPFSEPSSPAEVPPKSEPTSRPTSAVSSPQSVEVLYDNAVELGRQGQYREAIAELSVALRLDPNYKQAYQYRGYLKSLLGLERQAQADLDKAQVLDAIGPSASRKSAAEIEAIARGYSWHGMRSRFRRGGRSYSRASSRPFLFLWVMGVILAASVGLTWYMNNSSVPSQEATPRTPVSF